MQSTRRDIKFVVSVVIVCEQAGSTNLLLLLVVLLEGLFIEEAADLFVVHCFEDR